MTTAEIAIIISIISVQVAGLSLGWNIYRDVVLKAKVNISFGISTIVQRGGSDRPMYVNITATNFGPGAVNLSMVEVKNSSWWKWLLRKEEHAVVIHDYENPLSGQLPHKLEVGEKINLLFPYDENCFLKEGWSHIGVNDYFGRTHWASKKDVKAATQKWKKKFGQNT